MRKVFRINQIEHEHVEESMSEMVEARYSQHELELFRVNFLFSNFQHL